ncbi:hypothetical protein ACJBU6_02381 [Exserohilum turcicum]
MQSAGTVFAQRAKATLVHYLQDPTIAVVQGLILLGAFEVTTGNVNLGWTFHGVAFRMLFDLGLHQSPSSCLDDMSPIPEEGYLFAQRLFLVGFCHDTIFFWFIGRPRSVPFDAVQRVLTNSKLRDATDLIPCNLLAWTELSIIASNLQDVLNSSKPITCQDVEQLAATMDTLQNWHNALPSDIAWSDVETPLLSPSLQALHVQFFSIQVTFHRISRNSGLNFSEDALQGSSILPGFTAEESSRIPLENTVRISKAVEVQENAYDVECFVPVMNDCMYCAARVLIQHLNSVASLGGDLEILEEKTALTVILKVLQNISNRFPVVCEMLRSLTESLTNTQLTSRLERQGVDI